MVNILVWQAGGAGSITGRGRLFIYHMSSHDTATTTVARFLHLRCTRLSLLLAYAVVFGFLGRQIAVMCVHCVEGGIAFHLGAHVWKSRVTGHVALWTIRHASAMKAELSLPKEYRFSRYRQATHDSCLYSYALFCSFHTSWVQLVVRDIFSARISAPVSVRLWAALSSAKLSAHLM